MDSLDRTYLTSENCFLSMSQTRCVRAPAYSFSAVPDLCGPGAGAPVRRVNAWRPEAGPRRLQTRMRLRSLLTCRAARFLTDHRPAPVHGLALGTPVLDIFSNITLSGQPFAITSLEIQAPLLSFTMSLICRFLHSICHHLL